jgi:transcriptional regulator with XRE-family HTH domain
VRTVVHLDRRRPEPLWREVVGAELRRVRQSRGERLVDVARRAGVSPQYLSELERGRKDPSSEMLSSVAGSFGLSLLDLTRRASRQLGPTQPATSRPQARGPVLLAA